MWLAAAERPPPGQCNCALLAVGPLPTRGQFAAFVADTGYKAESACYIWLHSSTWENRSGRSWQSGFLLARRSSGGMRQLAGHQGYLAWLSLQDRKAYLPTESEWGIPGAPAPSRCRGDDADLACRQRPATARHGRYKFDWEPLCRTAARRHRTGRRFQAECLRFCTIPRQCLGGAGLPRPTTSAHRPTAAARDRGLPSACTAAAAGAARHCRARRCAAATRLLLRSPAAGFPRGTGLSLMYGRRSRFRGIPDDLRSIAVAGRCRKRCRTGRRGCPQLYRPSVVHPH